MLMVALTNHLEQHDYSGYRHSEVLLMAAYVERGIIARPDTRVIKRRNEGHSGSYLPNEAGCESSMTSKVP